MTPKEWAKRLYDLNAEHVQTDELSADAKAELIIEMADDDERTTFNSADLSSDDYGELSLELYKMCGGE